MIQRYPSWPRASRTSPDEHTRLNPKSFKKKKKAYNEYSQSANEGLSRDLAREREKERERERPERDNGIRSNIPGYREHGSPSIDFFIFSPCLRSFFTFVFPIVLCFYIFIFYFSVRYCLPPNPILYDI